MGSGRRDSQAGTFQTQFNQARTEINGSQELTPEQKAGFIASLNTAYNTSIKAETGRLNATDYATITGQKGQDTGVSLTAGIDAIRKQITDQTTKNTALRTALTETTNLAKENVNTRLQERSQAFFGATGLPQVLNLAQPSWRK